MVFHRPKALKSPPSTLSAWLYSNTSYVPSEASSWMARAASKEEYVLKTTFEPQLTTNSPSLLHRHAKRTRQIPPFRLCPHSLYPPWSFRIFTKILLWSHRFYPFNISLQKDSCSILRSWRYISQDTVRKRFPQKPRWLDVVAPFCPRKAKARMGRWHAFGRDFESRK